MSEGRIRMKEFEIKQRDERANRVVQKYGKTLWHYTDVNALNGILNNREIWFSSAANMNDKEELRGFISDLKVAVFHDITEDKNVKANEVFTKIEDKLTEQYPFIFSVSKAPDDAAQWERYAKQGKGIAIVFNTELLYKLIFYNHFVMDEEYYGYNAKQHKMKELLVDYIQNNKMEEFTNLEGLIDNLLLCAMIHKHESFSAEQEIRLSPYFIKDDDSRLQYKILSTIKKVFVLDIDKLCQKEGINLESIIDAIVIGPRSEQNVEDLKWYCKKIGLLRLAEKIYKSNCPLR